MSQVHMHSSYVVTLCCAYPLYKLRILHIPIPYVLLKALPPVCMKYTARDESRVANIARGEAECYICHETLIKSCIFYTNEVAVF